MMSKPQFLALAIHTLFFTQVVVSLPAPPGMTMNCFMAPSCFNSCTLDQICHVFTVPGDDCPTAECRAVPGRELDSRVKENLRDGVDDGVLSRDHVRSRTMLEEFLDAN